MDKENDFTLDYVLTYLIFLLQVRPTFIPQTTSVYHKPKTPLNDPEAEQLFSQPKKGIQTPTCGLLVQLLERFVAALWKL